MVAIVTPAGETRRRAGKKDLFQLGRNACDERLTLEGRRRKAMPPCGLPHGRLWRSRLPILNRSSASLGARAGAGVRLCLFGEGSQTGCSVKQRQTDIEKQVTLQDWFIVRCEDSEAVDATDPGDPKIAVGGIYISDSFERQVVRTTMIVERVKKQLLRTRDGVDVWLTGRMDVESTVANGFSLKVVQQFCTGFPAVWKPFLERCVAGIEDDIKERLTPSEAAEPQPSPQIPPPSAHEPMSTILEEPVCAVMDEQRPADGAGPSEPGSKMATLSKNQKRRLNRRTRRNQKRRKTAEIAVSVTADAEDQNAAQDAGYTPPVTDSGCEEDQIEQPVHGGESLRDSGTEVRSEGFLAELHSDQPSNEAVDANACRDDVVNSDTWNTIQTAAIEVPSFRCHEDAFQTTVSEVGQVAAKEMQEVQTERHEIQAERHDIQAERRDIQAQRRDIQAERLEIQAERHEIQVERQEIQAERHVKELIIDDVELHPHPSGKSEVTLDEFQSAVVVEDVVNIEVTPSSVIKDEEKETAKPVSRGMETRRSKTVKSSKSLTTPLSTPVIKAEKTRSRRSSIIPPPATAPVVPVSPDMVSKAFGLKTSRSGRLIVPPLAFWRNQTAVHDKDGGIIAIMDGFGAEDVPDTGRYNFEPPTEKQAVRLQKKLHKAVEQLQSPSPSSKRKCITRKPSA